MIEWALVPIGGLLGSAHCVGMCGPLALALGVQETSSGANLRRQLAYSFGRVFTYAFLGAAAGYGGARLASRSFSVVNAQALLAVFAGVFLLLMGLYSAGALRWMRWSWSAPSLCSVGLIRAFLASPGWTNAALAGVFTGFLPCGLVYAFVAQAAATGHPLWGAATMTLFGLGTMPLMVLTGCGATWMSLRWRTRVFQFAAWCIVLTGMISIARGMGYLEPGAGIQPGGCSFLPLHVTGS